MLAIPASRASSPSSLPDPPRSRPFPRAPAAAGLAADSISAVSEASNSWLMSSSLAAPPSPSSDSWGGAAGLPRLLWLRGAEADPPLPPAAKPSRGAVSEFRNCSGGDGANPPVEAMPGASGGAEVSCSTPSASASSRSSCIARTTCDLRGRCAMPPWLRTPSGASSTAAYALSLARRAMAMASSKRLRPRSYPLSMRAQELLR
mmetsp:Transcript_26959/g.81618  ORF Transcript_26959/g.81618 Transcript_26959/m.81618 type:complete len:204 (+) Transcript_26959:660-1271(+)